MKLIKTIATFFIFTFYSANLLSIPDCFPFNRQLPTNPFTYFQRTKQLDAPEQKPSSNQDEAMLTLKKEEEMRKTLADLQLKSKKLATNEEIDEFGAGLCYIATFLTGTIAIGCDQPWVKLLAGIFAASFLYDSITLHISKNEHAKSNQEAKTEIFSLSQAIEELEKKRAKKI